MIMDACTSRVGVPEEGENREAGRHGGYRERPVAGPDGEGGRREEEPGQHRRPVRAGEGAMHEELGRLPAEEELGRLPAEVEREAKDDGLPQAGGRARLQV